MKYLKMLFITSSLIFSFIQAKNNKQSDKELRKERITRLTKHLQGASQDCALMSYLENNREKLSSEEMDKYNSFRMTYNESMLKDVYSMTVSEYLQVLRSKNDTGMTIEEMADSSTKTTRFSFGDGDACYKLARGMERYEQVLSDLKARGKGDTIIRYLSYELQQELKR